MQKAQRDLPVAFFGARREPQCGRQRPVYLQWRWDQLIYSYQCVKAYPDLRSKLSSQGPWVLSGLLEENSFSRSNSQDSWWCYWLCFPFLTVYLVLLSAVAYFNRRSLTPPSHVLTVFYTSPVQSGKLASEFQKCYSQYTPAILQSK